MSTTYAADWEQDISTQRAELLNGREKSLSLARAKAGASGLRRGTQSWDTMIAQSQAGYNRALKDLEADTQNLESYKENQAAAASMGAASSAPSTASVEGAGAVASTAPGAGYTAPTTAAGQIAQGIGVGVAEEVRDASVTTIGTVVGATLGAGKHAGMVGSAIGTFVDLAMNPNELAATYDDTIGRMGPSHSFASNIQGLANMAAVATGWYGTVNAVKGVVGSIQAGTLDDEMWEAYDTVASAIDGGMNPSAGRAGRQSDAQARENAAQEDYFDAVDEAEFEADDNADSTGMAGGGGGGSVGEVAGDFGGYGSSDDGGQNSGTDAGTGGGDGSDNDSGAGGGSGSAGSSGDGGANGGEDGGNSDGNSW